MDTTELYTKSGESVNVWFCGKCNRVGWDKGAAERCCVPHVCKTCGKEEQMSECRDCSDVRHAKAERERFEKAEKVAQWDGWVFSDEGYGYKDGYFESVDDLLEYLSDANADHEERLTPEYVWTCKENQFVSVDPEEDIYERIEENGYEDFERGSLSGTDELEAAILAFEKANESVVSYEPDYSKALLLPDIQAAATTASSGTTDQDTVSE